MKIDISWYDRSSIEFTIDTPDQLFGLATIVNSEAGAKSVPHDNFSGKTIILSGDIDISKYATEWCPIGSDESPFEGTFDGRGNSISGLNTSLDSEMDEFSVFGTVGTLGEIRNLMVSGEIVGDSHLGGIAVVNGGNIKSCGFTGAIRGKTVIGGIVAMNYGTIARSYNRGVIDALGQHIGGIAGVNQNDVGEIKDCYNTGRISGVGMVGGITGYSKGIGVKNSFNTGAVTSTSASVGGIVGVNAAGSSIINCYNMAKIGDNTESGGIVGKNIGDITGCNNRGVIEGQDKVGGITGSNLNGKVNTCKNRGSVSGRIEVGGISGNNQAGEIKNCSNDSDIMATYGTVGGVVGSTKWGSVIGSFNDGTVASVDQKVGGIIGWCQYGGTIDCSNSGDVKGNSSVGGVAGLIEARGSLVRCNNSGVIAGLSRVGGLVGSVCGNITDSYSTGAVYGSTLYSAIVGESNGGVVENCYSIGRVHSKK